MTIEVENSGRAFSFEAPAEVFACGRRGHNPVRYRRFATTAEAVRFAIEGYHFEKVTRQVVAG